MPFGDAMSLVAVAALIVGAAWCLDSELREAYRAVRAAGAPRLAAIYAAVVLALFQGFWDASRVNDDVPGASTLQTDVIARRYEMRYDDTGR